MPNNTQGFTLIELLIVITIIGILAAVLVPNLLQARAKANNQATIAYIRNCLTAVEVQRNNITGAFPSGLNGMGCNDNLLGKVKQTEPSAIVAGSSKITLVPDGSVVVEATSVTGTKFSYNGQKYTVIP